MSGPVFLTQEQRGAIGENIQLALPVLVQLIGLEYAHAMKDERDPDAGTKDEENKYVPNIERAVFVSLQAAQLLKGAAVNQVKQATAPKITQ